MNEKEIGENTIFDFRKSEKGTFFKKSRKVNRIYRIEQGFPFENFYLGYVHKKNYNILLSIVNFFQMFTKTFKFPLIHMLNSKRDSPFIPSGPLIPANKTKF